MKAWLLLLALPVAAHAQDCKNFFYLTNNAQVQMTMYDKKGKETGITTWQISDVKKISGGYQSTITTNMQNEKGKQMASGTGTYKCQKGVLMADARMSLPSQQGSGGGSSTTEAKIDSAFIEYPSSMTAGQSLKDVDFKMEVNPSGVTTNVSFKETNRKVGAKESVTTPAGTWDAYVISYDGVFRSGIGPLSIPFNMSAKEWFVPGFGIVKTETYNKSGKLLGSTQITSIKK